MLFVDKECFLHHRQCLKKSSEDKTSATKSIEVANPTMCSSFLKKRQSQGSVFNARNIVYIFALLLAQRRLSSEFRSSTVKFFKTYVQWLVAMPTLSIYVHLTSFNFWCMHLNFAQYFHNVPAKACKMQ